MSMSLLLTTVQSLADDYRRSVVEFQQEVAGMDPTEMGKVFRYANGAIAAAAHLNVCQITIGLIRHARANGDNWETLYRQVEDQSHAVKVPNSVLPVGNLFEVELIVARTQMLSRVMRAYRRHVAHVKEMAKAMED